MACADHPMSLRSDDGQYAAQASAGVQGYSRADSTNLDAHNNFTAQQETGGQQGYAGGAHPMSLSSNNDGVGMQETSGSQVLLDDLNMWERALCDTKVWDLFIDKCFASDLLVHFYFLKSDWTSAVRQIKRNTGNRDAMEALLTYLIKSSNPKWPEKLQEGLIECDQKLLADRFSEKYEEICKRPIFGMDQVDGSIKEPPEPRSSLSLAIIQHRNLYEKAVRIHQKDLRSNINPLLLLNHIPYIHKDRIQAAMNTSGKGEATDTFLEELIYPQRDNDWPKDLIQALRNESQSVLADLLKKEYFDLRVEEFNQNRCGALRDYLRQQHPTPDAMDQAVPMDEEVAEKTVY